MNVKSLTNKYQAALLMLIPGLLFATGLCFIRNTGNFFISCVDPEYAYLFNGVTLAHFHPHLNGVGHPGTPVQVLIALVSRVVHLFRPGQPLWDGVMLNPELYIRASIYTGLSINTIALFSLGVFTHTCSRNLVISQVIQLAPFTHMVILESTGRLIPELLMTAIICGWFALLIKLIYDKGPHNYQKYSLLFGLLFGFSMADKLTFLPFFLLPFIVLPEWKYRLRFTLFSFLSFIVFAFPVMFSIPKFIGWVTGIITHKGVYGHGEKGILDWDIFLRNLDMMWSHTLMLLIPLGILIFLATLTIIRKRKNRPLALVPVRIVLALLALLPVQYIITAKHFAFYYLTPSLLLTIFVVFLIFLFLEILFPKTELKNVFIALLGIFGLWLIGHQSPKLIQSLKHRHEVIALKTTSYHQVKPLLKHTPKIICPYYYGSSSVEYGLLFGLHESGRFGKELTERVKRIYPSTVMYLSWGDVFYDGVYIRTPADFIQTSADHTLYIADFSTEKLNQVMTALQPDSCGYSLALEPLYQSPATAEAVYRLHVMNSETDAGTTHVISSVSSGNL